MYTPVINAVLGLPHPAIPSLRDRADAESWDAMIAAFAANFQRRGITANAQIELPGLGQPVTLDGGCLPRQVQEHLLLPPRPANGDARGVDEDTYETLLTLYDELRLEHAGDATDEADDGNEAEDDDVVSVGGDGNDASRN